jgi:tyrosyl-tRNA synthetase
MLSKNEIDAALELHKRDPKERHGQQILAREVTKLVHGEEEVTRAERISRTLFVDVFEEINAEDVATIREVAPTHETKEGISIVDVLTESKLAASKREARQFILDEAVTLNGKSITDPKRALESSDFKNGVALLKRGKKNVCVLVLS